MAASIARQIAAVLIALAVVGSFAVGPALADDDDDVEVGGDGVSVGGDDGITVGAGDDGSTNGSTTISADADTDGIDADAEVSGGDGSGTDGSIDCDISSDTQDPTNACETSGTDGGSGGVQVPDGDVPEAPDGDAPEAPGPGAFEDIEAPEAPDTGGGGTGTLTREISTPDESIEAPELPVSYQDDVPFEALPPFCDPPYGIDDAKEANPVDPTDPFAGTPVKNQSQVPDQVRNPPQTPVGNPIGLLSPPVNQCDVFNPYSPPVNPTDPPDDPSASVDTGSMSPGDTLWSASGTTGEGGPGFQTLSLITASQEESRVYQDVQATDGASPSGGTFNYESPNDPRKATVQGDFVIFGQSAGASLTCEDGSCKPKADGVPSGNAAPAIPTSGGGGGEDPQPGPSADTGQPTVRPSQNGVVIVDDRSATLGQGLPGGSNSGFIILTQDRQEAQQDFEGSGGGRSATVRNTYDGGENPGDDDYQVVAKGDGAGVVAGFQCNDYRCTPSDGTGVYDGPAGMVFDMLPSAPV